MKTTCVDVDGVDHCRDVSCLVLRTHSYTALLINQMFTSTCFLLCFQIFVHPLFLLYKLKLIQFRLKLVTSAFTTYLINISFITKHLQNHTLGKRTMSRKILVLEKLSYQRLVLKLPKKKPSDQLQIFFKMCNKLFKYHSKVPFCSVQSRHSLLLKS